MFQFAIERGIILSVGFLILCLFGIIAAFSVPVQMTPDLDRPVITVLTQWPGATPLDVEKEILVEQEEYLQNVRNLDRMTSTASMGRAEIKMEFVLGADMGEALVRVNNALSQVPGYPENVDQPRLISAASTDDPFIFYTISEIPDSAVGQPVFEQFDFLEDNFINALERVPGVAQITLFGGSNREVRIAVDPARLAARQLTMREVREAIRARNRDVSGGDIDTGKRRYVVRTVGRFDSMEALNNTIIAERSGHPVRLRDVGEATMDLAELRGKGYLNLDRSVVFMVRRDPGANVIEVKEQVSAAVRQLNQQMLARRGLVATLYADDVGYVVDAVKVVQKNLVLGGLLACLVLFLFLRNIYPTLLGALGVPICAIGALIGLLLMGRTVNVISLAGVAFALGMTLDNSIVVLENIYRQRLAGFSPVEASLRGVREMWQAILASTLTTVFVFVPIALMNNEAGQLYSDIAIAISAAVLMSMLVAITLVPSAMARMPFREPPADGWFSRLGAGFSAWLFASLNWLLANTRRQLLLVVTILLLAWLVIAYLTPRAEYLPEGEEPKIFALMFPPAGYNLEEVYQVGLSLARDIAPAAELPIDASYAEGDVPPLAYYLWLASPERLLAIAEPKARDTDTVARLQETLRERFSAVPGMIAFVNKGSIFSDNSGGARSIELDITGSDMASIFNTAMVAFQSTKAIFEKAQIRPDPGLSLSQPAIEINPDWDRANELGLKAQDLGYMVGALADGAFVDEFFLLDDKIDMFLYSTAGTVKKPEDIADLPIYVSSGNVLPLSAIAQVSETVSASKIRRVDGNRSVTLTIIPPRDVALEQAVEVVQREVIEKMQRNGEVPEDVTLGIGGASDKLDATKEALSGNFLIAILLSYLLMVAILSHWAYPLLILLSLPLGISGGLAGLWFMNNVLGVVMPLDMITLLGMIVLIGTVVNNPILLVEKARQNLREGMVPIDAVLESVRARLRPIMMSMLTTIFGLAPVVFLPGAGTELYRGLGTIVMFGLFFSTVLALSFVPALLVMLFNASARWEARRAQRVDKLPG
jgi:multidrug efflux pump subunit AcrB